MRQQSSLPALATAALTLALAHASTSLDSVSADAHGSLVHMRGDLLHRVIVPSDEMWCLAMLESDDKCGEACGRMRGILAEVGEKSDGVFRMAHLNARDIIVGHDGGDVEAHVEWNVSSIPVVMIYLPGPKRVETAMRMDTETSFQVLSSGKMLYSNLKQFHPTLVHSVRGGNLNAFLTRSTPALPRVLLVSSRKETPLLLKKLAYDFASRAVVGVAALTDDIVRNTAGLSSDSNTTLLVSPAGPLSMDSMPTWVRYAGGELKLGPLRTWMNANLDLAPVPLLLSPSDFTTSCSGSPDVNVCFIAVLPTHALPDVTVKRVADWDPEATGPGAVFKRVAGRAYAKNDLGTYSGGEMKAERYPIAFMAVDANGQEAFADAFEAPTPGLIALNPRKKVFALYRGAFTEEGITDFIMAMIEKASPMLEGLPPRKAELFITPISSIPPIVKQADPVKRKPAAKKTVKETKTKAATPTAAADPTAAAETDTARDEL